MEAIASVRPTTNSRQHRLNHFAMQFREAEVASTITVGNFFVIDTQLLQDSCMKIVDTDAVLDSFETELVGGTVSHAALDPAAGHPHRVAKGMVVASVGPLQIQARGRIPRPR